MWQKNFKILLVILLFGIMAVTPKAQAQMMENFTPSITPTQQDLQDIQSGQQLYNKFQNRQVGCNQLQDADFEKIGEYVMNQRFSNTNQHIQMNSNMKQMMGEQSEEQMHIYLGKGATGCNINSSSKGGVSTMMGWGYGNMMGNFGWGFSLLGSLFWLAALIDLVLLGIWLWKKIQK